ncbi:Regulatory protein AfsR [Paramyrothecium foliicola]|nr:Regulatory protein AfsR [Paramyrothecium foliicola]
MQLPAQSLRLIDKVIYPALHGIEVDIIAVASCGSLPVDDWGITAALGLLPKDPDSVSRICISTFDYSDELEDLKTWSALLDLGNNLLDILQQRTARAHDNRTIFICHSLGGLLLKKALNSACLRRERFQRLLDSILGIVFLGTPHSAERDDETWKRYVDIAQSFGSKKGTLKPFSPAEDAANDTYQICTLGVEFEKNGLPISVLSVYDGKATKFGRTRMFRAKSVKLVDKNLSKTSLAHEELWQSEFAHADLCRFSMFLQTNRIIAFLHGLLKSVKRTTSISSRATASHRDGSAFPATLPTPPPPAPVGQTPGEALSGRSSSSFSHVSAEYSLSSIQTLSASGLSSGRSSAAFPPADLPARILPRYTPNPDFFGRGEELKKLDRHLLTSNCSGAPNSRHFAVCGMAGVGKTELTVEWFYRNMTRFPAMFWIDAAEPSQLASNYAKIVQVLKIRPPEQAEDLVANREIAKTWFANATDPWLLVFDNADNLDLLADYWPYGGAGSILVTSRDPFAKAFRSFTMPGIDLEPFTESDASEFIRRVTGCDTSNAEHQASLDMARELGCLPLAIVQMAGVIRRREWSLQQFLENYHTLYHALRRMDNPQLHRYGQPLATAWNFDDLPSSASQLLKLLSMLSPDRIPESLFVSPSASNDKALLFADLTGFEEAKDALLSCSAVKRNKITRELSIHRIVAQECRACMSPDTLYDNFYLAVDVLSAAWPFNDKLESRHSTIRWSKCEALFPHVEHVHKLYSMRKRDWVSHDHAMSLVRLFQDGGAYLHERGFSFQGKPYLEHALELFGKVQQKPSNHEEILSDIYYTLGAIANEINDGPGCLANNLILLQMRKQSSEDNGKPDVRLAAAHSQIGIAYMMMGKLALATEYFKQSLEIFKGLEDFHVDMLGFPAANLGLSYWLQGQLGDAEEVFATTLKEREAVTGRILHGYGNVKASQAEVTKRKGDVVEYQRLMKESFALHQASLTQLESTLGEYHHRVADLCHKIAGHYMAANQHDLAQMAIRARSKDEKDVYDTVKGFFKGQHLNERKLSHVRALINQNLKYKDIPPSLQRRNIEEVYRCAHQLLLHQIFSSEQKAKARFGTLPPATVQLAATAASPQVRAAPPVNTAQLPAKVDQGKPNIIPTTRLATRISSATDPHTEVTRTVDTLHGHHQCGKAGLAHEKTTSDTVKQVSTSYTFNMSPLSRSRSKLPYNAQYFLFVETQRYLEIACWEFAREHLPSLLTKQGWDCVEAIELNIIVRQLQGHQDKLFCTKTERLSHNLVHSIILIRHSAVHRRRVSAFEMYKLLQHAERFLALLGDSERSDQVSSLRRSAFETLTILDREEQAAEGALVKKHQDIEKHIEALRNHEKVHALKIERPREKSRGLAARNIIHATGSITGHHGYIAQVERSFKLLFLVIFAICNGLGTCLKFMGRGCVLLFIFFLDAIRSRSLPRRLFS